MDRLTLIPIDSNDNKIIFGLLTLETRVVFALKGDYKNPTAQIVRLKANEKIPFPIPDIPEDNSEVTDTESTSLSGKPTPIYQSHLAQTTVDTFDTLRNILLKKALREFLLRTHHLIPQNSEEIKLYNEGITYEFIAEMTILINQQTLNKNEP